MTEIYVCLRTVCSPGVPPVLNAGATLRGRNSVAPITEHIRRSNTFYTGSGCLFHVLHTY